MTKAEKGEGEPCFVEQPGRYFGLGRKKGE